MGSNKENGYEVHRTDFHVFKKHPTFHKDLFILCEEESTTSLFLGCPFDIDWWSKSKKVLRSMLYFLACKQTGCKNLIT